MADPIRIANCSGFFGDRLSAAKEMVEGGPIDHEVLDNGERLDPEGLDHDFIAILEMAHVELAQRPDRRRARRADDAYPCANAHEATRSRLRPDLREPDGTSHGQLSRQGHPSRDERRWPRPGPLRRGGP